MAVHAAAGLKAAPPCVLQYAPLHPEGTSCRGGAHKHLHKAEAVTCA